MSTVKDKAQVVLCTKSSDCQPVVNIVEQCGLCLLSRPLTRCLGGGNSELNYGVDGAVPREVETFKPWSTRSAKGNQPCVPTCNPPYTPYYLR